MGLHAFVVMPFGKKERIDFNKVYNIYIKPALESAGFEVFRADKDMRGGDIRSDMFQELLLADLVVADLSIDNPNVWYELGVRHALRKRGVVQIQCKRDYMPFDIYSDRTLRYRIKNGVPDKKYLKADKKALAKFATKTMTSWYGRKISPVYNLLGYLKEPDWKSLRVNEAEEFWEAEEAWESRVEIARRKDRPGDIMVLAEEMPTRVLRLEARRAAGKALIKLLKFPFALEQFEKALAIDPKDVESRGQKGIILGRLKKYEDAAVWLQELVDDHSNDPEAHALLGRVKKDAWVDSWRKSGRTSEEMCKTAAEEASLLREAIAPYARGFSLDCCHFYSGINALTLLHLLKHLTGNTGQYGEPGAMEGGVRWAVHSAIQRIKEKNKKDYWAQVTLGDLEVLVSDENRVKETYSDAVAVAERDWFALESSRQQLLILRDLGFRPPQVEAAISVFDHALEKVKPPEQDLEKQKIPPLQPKLVFLFSGHMIDAPGRKPPRFPEKKEKIAADAISSTLAKLGAGPEDIGLCGGACGGDLLFAEACLKLGVHLQIRIPFDEPTFLKNSVTFADGNWRDRYYAVKNNKLTTLFVMPEELGPTPENANPYERNNLWQLCTALSMGPEKVRFICLWDGKGGDGPGGTKHMHDSVKKRSGLVYVLDTNALFKKGE